jgi:hypothetical protein
MAVTGSRFAMAKRPKQPKQNDSRLSESERMPLDALKYANSAKNAFGQNLHAFLAAHGVSSTASNLKGLDSIGIGVLDSALEIVRANGEFPIQPAEFGRLVNHYVHDESNTIARLLAALLNRQLCIQESYVGSVVHNVPEEIVVTYEIGDDLVEHSYNRSQFLPDRMPKQHDRVEIFVYLAYRTPADAEAAEPRTTEEQDEQIRQRKNTISGPQEF